NAGTDDLVFLALHDPASGASELLTTVERKNGAVVAATRHLQGSLLLDASPLGTLRAGGPTPSQVVPVVLQQLSSIQTTVNRWPVTDHGTAAHPDGVGAGLAALQAAASLNGAPNLGVVIKELSLPGFYAEAGALSVANRAQTVSIPEITRAFANLAPMFDKLPKVERDRLVVENTLASMQFLSRPGIVGFIYETIGKVGAATVESGSANHLSVIHPAQVAPKQLTVSAGGFGSFTLPFVANQAPHPVDDVLPLSSTVVDLSPIKDMLGDIARMAQASSEAQRDAINLELAIKANLPQMAAQIRNAFGQTWTESPLGSIVARTQSAELRILGHKVTIHLPNGAELARSAGDPFSVVDDADLGSVPEGTQVARTVSAFTEDIGGILLQVSVAAARMSFAPFEITPEEVEIEEGDLEVEFTASVDPPPAGGYIIEWNWGDGETTEVAGATQASHEYDSPANYQVIATLMAAGSRALLAVDTAEVRGEGSIWIGSATVVAVSTIPGNMHTEFAEVTDIRFELDPEYESSDQQYLAVSGVAKMWNEAPCAGYVSPIVFANLADTPNQQWLRTRTSNPVPGGTPETGLWYTGNAYTPGALKTKPCPTDFNPNPAEYTYTSGMVWLETYNDEMPETLWRAASNQNLIEGTMTMQISPNVTYTWTWRFERVAAGP
ncbi:MAG TPA: PKD domain-containing protein, partial [Gemmatimonadales bacterium]|nr:PKD domain-containing protein [Gemmatimonadales bacterium]